MSKFTIKQEEKDVELEFIKPTVEILEEATAKYNREFARLLNNKGLLRKKLAGYLREQNLWDDKKQKELEDLQKVIAENEYKLHKGKIKLNDAKEIALSIKRDRLKQAILLSAYNEYDNMTVEGQCDNIRFNYLVSACTVYSNNKERYFKSYEDYITSEDPNSAIIASKYAQEFYGVNDDFDSNLPENKFLKRYSFVDDKLRLINKDGQLVDEEGRLVNENGNLIDAEGNIIDIYGYKRNEDGEFLDEPEPFLDDDGNPISVDS